MNRIVSAHPKCLVHKIDDPWFSAARKQSRTFQRTPMLDLDRSVVDSDRDPLNTMPLAQRFQVMEVLNLIWTTIFCMAAGAWFWYGELTAIHLLIASGGAITGSTFDAGPNTKFYRDHPKSDGTTRYDDAWAA